MTKTNTDKIIGIRREDKNEWERRTPIVPSHARELREKYGIHTIVQPSRIRVFSDDEYKSAGAEVNEDLSRANVIFAVKEIPPHFFQEGKTYIFFSHTIKGQSYNMPMLKAMIDHKCNLIDYETVVDEKHRRLIFFGRYAGLAGMIETLHAFGQKLKLLGHETPFERIKQAFQYESLDEAKAEIGAIGEEINREGFPESLCPLVVGFTGYGHVSQGAQEIFNLLPHKTLSAGILTEMAENFSLDNFNLYKVVFHEEDIVKPLSGVFNLQDYYDHPEKYVSRFEGYLRYLTILVNGIYWTAKYPRLVTKEYLRNSTVLDPNLTLKVIGDISCDIDGSIEITHKATKPDNPTFTYFAGTDTHENGVKRSGVAVMAVDNLPCEFSREASMEFSSVLKDYVLPVIEADFGQDFGALKLPFSLKKALILQKGKLTNDYSYMNEFIKQEDK